MHSTGRNRRLTRSRFGLEHERTSRLAPRPEEGLAGWGWKHGAAAGEG